MKTKKRSYHLSAELLGLYHIVNPALVILLHYVHKKVDEGGPKLATFRTNTFNFFPGYTFKLVGKNWIESSILLVITVVSEDTKRNRNRRNNRLFCHIFITGGISTALDSGTVIQRLQVRFLREDNFFVLLVFF